MRLCGQPRKTLPDITEKSNQTKYYCHYLNLPKQKSVDNVGVIQTRYIANRTNIHKIHLNGLA